MALRGGAGSVPPRIDQVSKDRILYSETSSRIWADEIRGPNPLDSVWAVIISPEFRPSDQPVLDLPEEDLLDTDKDGIYEVTYGEFSEVGTYKVLIYAKDEDDLISVPRIIKIYQTGPDHFEDDDTVDQASTIILNDQTPQHHNFHEAGDEDWLQFEAIAGETYSIEAFNLGSNCNVVIELYNTDGTSLLAIQNNDTDPGAEERLVWLCPQNGSYYVKVQQYQSNIFGIDTEYDLMIGISQDECKGDIDGDDDVDGEDLAGVILNAVGISVMDFAAGYGNFDCPN